MRGILSTAPLDLVDFFLDFERLQVVELGLMGLELGVELVFARFFLQKGRLEILHPPLGGGIGAG
jgi:hypothetical protein